MQFRARLAAVSGTKAADSPNVISVKLEPSELLEADWLFGRLGTYLVVTLGEAESSLGPLFEEADDEPADETETVLVPSAGRRRNGTRTSERV